MMIYAILEIVGFISNKNYKSSDSYKASETKIDIAIEHNNKDDDNVKDATIVEDKTDDKKKKKKKK